MCKYAGTRFKQSLTVELPSSRSQLNSNLLLVNISKTITPFVMKLSDFVYFTFQDEEECYPMQNSLFYISHKLLFKIGRQSIFGAEKKLSHIF